MKSWLQHYWTDIGIVILALGAGWIILTARLWPVTTGGTTPSPREGFQAPEIALKTDRGEAADLGQLRGKVVLVNFWASWCPPCKAEMPAMAAIYADYHERGFEILAVDAAHQDTIPAVQAFIEQNSIRFPILMDFEGIVNQRYQVQALPSSFFVDRNGVIRKVVIGGPMSEALIRAEIDQLLQEAP